MVLEVKSTFPGTTSCEGSASAASSSLSSSHARTRGVYRPVLARTTRFVGGSTNRWAGRALGRALLRRALLQQSKANRPTE